MKKFFNKKTIQIAAIDLFSYMLFFFNVLFFGSIFRSKLEGIYLPDSVFELTEDQLIILSSELKNSFFFVVVLLILFLIVSYLIWGISRAIIWRMIVGKKINIKYIKASAIVSIIWFTIGTLFYIFLAGFKYLIVSVSIGFIIYYYLSILLFIMIAENGKVKNLKNVYKVGVRRLKDVGSTVLIVTVVIYTITQAINILYYPGSIVGIFAVLVYIFVSVYARYIILDIYKKRG